jgi:hypothetical protein
VLPFRSPIVAPPAVVLPADNASLPDMIQWFTLNQPHTLELVHECLRKVLHQMRPPPQKRKRESALLVTLNSQQEFRTVKVHDPSVLLSPAEGRLGRKMRDVLPSALMDRFDRALFKAKRTGKPSSYLFPVDETIGRGTVLTPTADTIIISVSKVLGLVMVCM